MNINKSKCLIFCHGWGGTVNFWNNLKPYFCNDLINQQLNLNLNNIYYLDLGYFSDNNYNNINLPKNILNNPNLELFAIGHSLGLIKLLKLNLNFKGFIGLQGFINFLGKDKQLRSKRTQELSNLIKQFNQDPINTLKRFYQFIEVKFEFKPQYANLNQAKLLEDLYLLTNMDNINTNIMNMQGLIIGAKNDLIVPAELIFDNFAAYKNVKINILSTGEHGLGYKQPGIIYQQIFDFLGKL